MRAPAADGEVEEGGGGGGEEGGRPLAGQGQARLVEQEAGAGGHEHGDGEHGGADGIDRHPMRPDLVRERLVDVRVLVEVEVALLHEAGRHALGRSRIAGPDGPSVRDEGDEEDEPEGRGQKRRRPDGGR
jgi:hypothetical protein